MLETEQEESKEKEREISKKQREKIWAKYEKNLCTYLFGAEGELCFFKIYLCDNINIRPYVI